MPDTHQQQGGSTTQAVAAQVQSRESGPEPKPGPAPGAPVTDGLGTRYLIGASVTRAVAKPFVRKRDDPLYRPLRVLTSDPAASRLEGSVALLKVPYESLRPGPEGSLFRVDSTDPQRQTSYRPADLDEPAALLGGGFAPSPSDPRFHQQMVYAVCSSVYATFRKALGRHVAWGFTRERDPTRLVLKPFAFKGANAHYDRERGTLSFGYDVAPAATSAKRTLPGGYFFTCLSHDVVVHELTHALLDGMRSHFSMPSGSDVAAFHEGFSDLVAIFQRLSYRELVTTAVRKSRGQLHQAPLLTDLAKQLGQVRGEKSALRSALTRNPPIQYDEHAEPHVLGNVLVCAVFEAYLTIFERKTAPLLRLATNGTGVAPPGELPADLVDLLAHKACTLASHFLSLIIRAIDYCPPVSIRLGEYLRALITADHDLVPDDTWAYREALIDAFARRNIYPRHVATLAEDALLWRPPRASMATVPELDFGHLEFAGDPANAANDEELRRQARALGNFATLPAHLHEFGLLSPIAAQALGAHAELPQVQSIRSTRRIGPDGQIVFDLVAEITQVLVMAATPDHASYSVVGGSTVILGPDGEVRYLISKSPAGSDRAQRCHQFMDGALGQQFWRIESGRYVQKASLFQMLHEQ